MSSVYDNWEKLVAAVLKKEQLWHLFRAPSLTPSVVSDASDSSSSSFSTPFIDNTYCYAPPKLVFVSDFSPSFDVQDVMLASTKILGRGIFGTAYAATMDNRVKFVVNRLKPMPISVSEFERHMEIVASVGHENVVPLRAYYSSENGRIVLYDYYSKGSVFSILHGQPGQDPTQINWQMRLKIAIGAARGIAEIHKGNGGNLVHGNIKSSNIFLNPQGYGCVSDLGPANLIGTMFVPTTLCYAPEVKNTKNISQASDVYSFGILLLELLTRKCPVHVPGGPLAVDLAKLVSSIKSKSMAANVFDAYLLQYPNIKDEVVKLLQIGIKCVAKSVMKRPKMVDVVTMLEDLNIYVGNNVISGGKLVYFEDVSPSFDLEDILRPSAQVLGNGVYGISYKVELFNGETIVVKRLRDLKVTFDEFKKHVEVIGRIRHTNVSKLIAYYFSKDLKLLVYDYCHQKSVSAMLHERRDVNMLPWVWESRLKTAVGAARGIAYIHRQDHGKFVHGNIKSSHIFLDKQGYGVVSGVGLAKIMKPLRLYDSKTCNYLAPEVKALNCASQASDVYSFGVVLLELVSGRCSETTANGEDIFLVDWVHSIGSDEWASQVPDFELNMSGCEEEMMMLFQIAMECVAATPEHRPTMHQVVQMLKEMRGMELLPEPEPEPEPETVTEDGLGQPSTKSRLEELLTDLLPTLAS